VSSVTILLLLPSLLFNDTSQPSSAIRGSKPLSRGPSILHSSSNHTTITRSSGGSTPRVIFKTTPKSVDTKRYVDLYPVSHPLFLHHPQTRRGVFQSDPILETLLVYYSSSGIMEPVPTKDPGPGNRPFGALALATAAVRCARLPSHHHTETTRSG